MLFEIKPFVKSQHMALIAAWMGSRGRRIPPISEMPKVGYVVFLDSYPVAAGFIRKVEGGFGQLDSLVSNPIAPAKTRDAAIDAIVTQLLKRAKSMKIPHLLAMSEDENTLVRSEKHGFKKLPLTLIAVDLTK